MAIVFENNRSYCAIHCLTPGDFSPGWKQYLVKLAAVISENNLVFYMIL